MIKIFLQNNKKGNIIFRAMIDEEDRTNLIIRRSLFESKVVKCNKEFPYVVPMKYLLPIINNLNKENIEFCNNSISEFLEFSDEYDENYYYTHKVTPNYMKKWRDEGCPKIYRVAIDKNSLSVKKDIVFKRLM